jgi:hypothetical protein
MGQPQGVAPTICHCVAPSPVGADPCVCPFTNAPHRRRQSGNHGGCPYDLPLRCTITRRGRPLCLPLHKCPTQAPPIGQPRRVAPTICHCVTPSPVGADPCVRPTANAIRTGTRQWGNHGGLPLRFAMNHHPSGRTPVSAHSQMPHAGAANRATTGGCPYGLALPQPHARNPAGVAVARRTAPPYP